MKTLIIILAAGIFSCKHDAKESVNLHGIELELLFEHDGCKMYRFNDGGRSVYWSDCRGGTESSHWSGGKHGHTVYDKSITTK